MCLYPVSVVCIYVQLVVLDTDYGNSAFFARAYKPRTSRAVPLAECELEESHLQPLSAAHGFPLYYFDRDARRETRHTGMLRTGDFRDASRGEGARRRGEPERKRLSLRITQDEGRKYHHYCNHSGGGLKMERSQHQRTEIEANTTLQQEQQLLMEKKAVIIQRAWRTLLERKQGWQEEPKNLINHFEMVSQEDALPTNLPPGELGQNLTLLFPEAWLPSESCGSMN
ncbi:hypothetical protein AMELA_G00218510 [Ameiurus melas]|uniref:Uncharacterized protein n=1 Tax=Ameiurus melas TaxID=219545 RepID=A0A7J6A1V8_AMEME|nr:hypothetical protein AMELA_G00218510 [Ameiurus melas]